MDKCMYIRTAPRMCYPFTQVLCRDFVYYYFPPIYAITNPSYICITVLQYITIVLFNPIPAP